MGKSKGKRVALAGKTSASTTAVIKSRSPASETTLVKTDPSLSGLGNTDDKGLLAMQKPGDPDMTTSCSTEISDSLDRNLGLSPQAFDVNSDCEKDLALEQTVFHPHPDLVGSRSPSSTMRKSIKSLPTSASSSRTSSPAICQNPTNSPSCSSPSESPATYASSTSFQSSTPSVLPTTAQPTHSPTSSQASSSRESTRISPEPNHVSETCSGSGIPIKQALGSQTDVKQHGMSNPLKPEMRNSEIGKPFKEPRSELRSGQRDPETVRRLGRLRFIEGPERIHTLVYRLADLIGPFPLTLYTGIVEYYHLKFRDDMRTCLHLSKWTIEEYIDSRDGDLMNDEEVEKWEQVLKKYYADEIEQHGIRHLCETYLWDLAQENPRGYPPPYFYEQELTPEMVEEAVEALCEPLTYLYDWPGNEARKAILLRAMADGERFGIYDQSPTVSQISTTVQSTSSVSSTSAPLTKSPTKPPLLPPISEATRVKETMAETCSGSGIPIKQALGSQTDVKQHGMSNPLKPEMRNSEIGKPFKEPRSELRSGQRDPETVRRLGRLRFIEGPERIHTLVYRLADLIGPFPLTLYTGIVEYYHLKFRDDMRTCLHLSKWTIEEYIDSRDGDLMNDEEAEKWEQVLKKYYADEIEQHGIRHLCETYLWDLAQENPRGYPPPYFYEQELTPEMVEEAVEAQCEPLTYLYDWPGDKARKAILLRAKADGERFGIYDQ